jgi:dienelactone hydrolase
MTNRGESQGWILDLGLRTGGFDVLHPEGFKAFQGLGYDQTDLERVGALVKSADMLPKAFSEVAAQVERRGDEFAQDGFADTAYGMYRRAALLWSRGQYSIYGVTDPRKRALRERCNAAVAKMMELRKGRIERIELEFEGSPVFAHLHLPAGEVRNASAVLLSPGMDMTKEDLIHVGQEHFAAHGQVALALDLPGMGESRLHGTTVDVTNPERAISRFLDYLVERPEVDATRIGLFGMSMSTYWGMRGAAHDDRLQGVAGFMGCYGDVDRLFTSGQPNYKTNFMAMSGYTDEDRFDVEIGSRMNLWDLAADITCPVLMGVGEFDELVPLDESLALYELLGGPKEIRVYENEFHPLGGISGEMVGYGAEWLRRALDGAFDDGRDFRAYVRPTGEVRRGSADPAWWLGERPESIGTFVARHSPDA